MDMVKAICATKPDGSPAFTDAELEQICLQRAEAEGEMVEEDEVDHEP